MDAENDFSKLSAENVESRYAQMTPEEHKDMQDWLDFIAEPLDTSEQV